MLLKNKKTGEIETACPIYVQNCGEYSSLAELNEEWEDVPEEPKGWCVTMYGGISRITKDDEILIPDLKEIGNYFNDKESAYDALDKLKAWKRLKDFGFKFEGTNNSKRKTGYFINYYLGRSFNSQNECEQAMKDLDLLFGGEE